MSKKESVVMQRVVPALVFGLALVGCSDAKPSEPKPAAPVATTVTPIDVPTFAVSTSPADIAKGQEAFAAKGCTACHKIGGGKLVGPDLKGITERRDETWIKRMILRPDVMVKEDSTARKLLAEYLVPMPNQGVDPTQELPLILAYLKSTQ